MLLGINRVVSADQMLPGRFYLRQNYRDAPVLFLLAQGIFNGDMAWRVVEFEPEGEHPIVIQEVMDYGPVIELPDISVRIDAPSLSGTARTHSPRAPMLLVEEEHAYVVALTGWRSATIVRISDGEILPQSIQKWASFSRWQLVMDDNGEEIPIASFGMAGDQ